MTARTFCVAALLIAGNIISSGQIRKECLLYPEGIPDNPISFTEPESYVDSIVKPGSLSAENRVFSFVTEPSYVLYPAPDSVNTGIGLIIFPGGGLVNVWMDKEGSDLAIWLSERGINCMVVKYRTNARNSDGKFKYSMDLNKDVAVMDARTSMLRMKELADSLHIDKNRIGVMGFSAGGWLTEKFVFRYYEGDYEWLPSFAGLIYYGNSLKVIKKLDHKEKLPPFFMAASKSDRKLPLNRILPYLTEILSEVENSELHIYAKGPHGFGLAYDDGHSVELWKESFLGWMLDINKL